MARPREFDEAAVLDAAVQCFWAQGYEATSMRDLVENMGITSASLYNAFGDKRGLYLRALQRYRQQGFNARIERIERLPPREAIQAFFDDIIERSLADPQLKGCLMVNSSFESGPHDPEFQQVVAEHFIRVEAFFRDCILAGQQDGSIAAAQPANDLARLLLGVLVGVRVLTRSRPERELLEGIVRPALALLDSPTPQGDAS